MVPKRQSKMATNDAETGGQIGGEMLRIGKYERHGHVRGTGGARFNGQQYRNGAPQSPLHVAGRGRQSLQFRLFLRYVNAVVSVCCENILVPILVLLCWGRVKHFMYKVSQNLRKENSCANASFPRYRVFHDYVDFQS